MAKKDYLYMGPAATFNGKAVPGDGLKVNMDEAQMREMSRRGHSFQDDTSAAASQGATVPADADKENAKK